MRLDGIGAALSTSEPKPKVSLQLRADFDRELKTRIQGLLGKPGTEQFEKMQRVYDSLLGEPGTDGRRPVDLEQLPDQAKGDLNRLQHRSEEMEAMFVKMMLKDLQRMNPIGGDGQMAGLARDFMNDAIAQATTQSGEGLGIAESIFLNVAETQIRNFAGRQLADEALTRQNDDT